MLPIGILLSGFSDAEFVVETSESVGLLGRPGADAVGGDAGLLLDAVAGGEGLAIPEDGDAGFFGICWAPREELDPFMVAKRRRRSSKGVDVLP